jgi:hypothetical protein
MIGVALPSRHRNRRDSTSSTVCPKDAIERHSAGRFAGALTTLASPLQFELAKTDVTSAFRLLRAGALAGCAFRRPW